jgi:competence protein ComEA
MGEARRAAWAALALSLVLVVRSAPLRLRSERPAAPAPARGAARLLWGLPLDVNRDDARDLEALPGIGPGRAHAIVASRPHCALEDLDRVPGIGPATLRGLEGRVRVGRSPLCPRNEGD